MIDNPVFHHLLLMLAGGLLTTLWSAWLLRPARSSFLPPQRCRAVPWSGWEILGAFLISNLAVAVSLSFMGKDPPANWRIWAQLLGSAIGFVACIGVPCFVSHTRPYQLGLTSHRLGANVFLGVIAVLCLTPLVMGMYFVIADFMQESGIKPEEHTLTQVGRAHTLLTVLSAMVAAPLVEEVLARGLFQRWLTTRRAGWAIAICTGLFLSLLSRLGMIETAMHTEHPWRDVLPQLQTMGFVVATIPPFLFLRRYFPSPIIGAIYGSSIAFAAAHAAVWPSPIPLFFLALGLGLIAYRTQSLIPSIVAHSLFNGLNVCVLFWEKT